MALLITASVAFGVSLLPAELASDYPSAGWITLAGATSMVVLSTIGMIWTTRRSLGAQVGAKGAGRGTASGTPSAPSAGSERPA